MSARVLVVDDELSVREFFEILLSKEGYQVVTAEDGVHALELIRDQGFDLVITDLQMSRGDGMTLLKESKLIDPSVPVIMMTAYATTDSAVEAMKLGAFDYLSKPFKIDEIKVTLTKALENRNLLSENKNLKNQLQTKYDFKNLIGESEPMQRVYELIRKTAATKTNVLIAGESGTGKELVAKAIHFNSERKDKPFITVNCGAIPENLIESELFGHVKGSFTGAVVDKEGLFGVADKGTIFLDEIGELPLAMQVKLLRVIQERTFMAVGGTKLKEVDVRIIAATNRDLGLEVQTGNFREDLYYRLNVIQIKLPPLRNRKVDIPVLAAHFLTKYASDAKKKILGVNSKTMEYLMNYDFLGNVRELENVIERSVALEGTNEIQVSSLPSNVLHPEQNKDKLTFEGGAIDLDRGGIALDDLMDCFEKDLLLRALERTRGSRTKAAKLLGITTRSIRYRIKKHLLEELDDIDLDEKSEHSENEMASDFMKRFGLGD